MVKFAFRMAEFGKALLGEGSGKAFLHQATAIAQKMIDDGRIDRFVADRYSSWNTGIGKDIIDGKVGFAELEKYVLEKGEVTDSLGSGRQEMLESIMNNIMFSL